MGLKQLGYPFQARCDVLHRVYNRVSPARPLTFSCVGDMRGLQGWGQALGVRGVLRRVEAFGASRHLRFGGTRVAGLRSFGSGSSSQAQLFAVAMSALFAALVACAFLSLYLKH